MMTTLRDTFKVFDFSKGLLALFALLLACAAWPMPSYAASNGICVIPDESPTVVIGGCDTGVPNSKDADGCTLWLRIMQCAGSAKNHKSFVSCVSRLTTKLNKTGVVSRDEKSRIQSCAAEADYPCSDCGVVVAKHPGFSFEKTRNALNSALLTLYHAYVMTPGPDDDRVLLGEQQEGAIRYLQAHGEKAAAALVKEAKKLDPLDQGRGRVILHLISRFESETGIQYLYGRAKSTTASDCSYGNAGEVTCSAASSLRTAALDGLGHICSLGSAAARQRLLDLVGDEDAAVQRQAIGVFYESAGISRWRAKRLMSERLPASKRCLLHEIY